ncbi:MAG: SAM-dependent methyltransferase [Clostridiales bacterium]|nr:SAM-dependent methyltransferase [Clostridiales bacterium]
MSRLKEIFSNIEKAKKFADVGCDHGIIAQMVVKENLADTVIITDISKDSLKKAEDLLKEEMSVGKVKSYFTDGLNGVDLDVDECLIAGMGGKEIIKILTDRKEEFRPNRLILQPMKNVDNLRVFLVENGYKILKDYVFKDRKFYDLIIAIKGEDSLTPNEIAFGRTNLIEKGEAFKERTQIELDKVLKRLQNPDLSTENYFRFLGKVMQLKGLL